MLKMKIWMLLTILCASGLLLFFLFQYQPSKVDINITTNVIGDIDFEYSYFISQYPKKFIYIPKGVIFEGYITNKYDIPIQINKTFLRFFDNKGNEITKQDFHFGGGGNRYVILYPGESISVWLGQKSLPRWYEKKWSDVELTLQMSTIVTERQLCTHIHTNDASITSAGMIDQNTYEITGKLAPTYDNVFTKFLYVSFFNEAGKYIGRRSVYITNENDIFEDQFNIFETEVALSVLGARSSGGYIGEAPTNYKIDFLEYYYRTPPQNCNPRND